MSGWDGFDQSIIANRYQQMFIQGFLDVSGRVIIRNGDLSLNNGNLCVGYDASINGNVFTNGDVNISGYLRPTTFIGFHLYRSTSFASITSNTIISNTHFDSNYFAHSSMNTTSCIFTAPVNGYYQFSYTTTIVPLNSTQTVNLMLSTSASPTTTTAATDTIVGTIFYLPRTGSTEPINIPGAFSGIVKMAKNYTVYLYSPASRGGSVISGGADGGNFFSGYLINAY